ncbi:MAG TPA: tyrosine--tRNA ligase [Candidatus Nanoarchaeia archaeon]|nr:tyrosine--tRNA ligase [Candidatus Nanoarchaeia archaeon]
MGNYLAMNIQERINLIREVGEEIITLDDLKSLLEVKKNPIAYDGFEPSGNIHIAQGIMRSININKMLKAGCKFKILVADWHAWANNKLGGNLEKIQITGKYLIEVWKACGMDTEKIEFIWVSNYIKDPNYWKKVMTVARHTTLQRIIRCSQIMGRKESDALQASQILYPCMQCADIFHLEVDIVQLGMDQRKVNMLAKEIGPKIGFYSPVAVHHHMLLGLDQPNSQTNDTIDKAIDLKMSKSKPTSAIFMTDSKEAIERKIKKAYCPEAQEKDNPILEYCKYIIFQQKKEFKIERSQKFGGDLSFKNYEDLIEVYANKQLHPMDLKNATAKEIDILIKPVRAYFERNKKAKELKEKVDSFIM